MTRLVPALVLLAACAPSAGPSTTVTTAPTTTTSTVPTMEQAEAAFVRCLGDEGIDLPQTGEGGNLPLLDRLAPHLDLRDPAVRDVVVACAPLLLLAGPIESDPEVAELVSAQLAAFAECMRSEGLVEFPDPLEDGSWPLDEVPFADPRFDDAMTSCTAGLVVDS